MPSNPAELAVQIAVTRAFVDADYQEIVLTPRVQVRTAAGGFVYNNLPPREPQRFHVVERVSNAASNNRVQGGAQDEVEFTLVGYAWAEVGPHDIFSLRGSQWEVASVDWFNGYEQRAQVIRYGRSGG